MKTLLAIKEQSENLVRELKFCNDGQAYINRLNYISDIYEEKIIDLRISVSTLKKIYNILDIARTLRSHYRRLYYTSANLSHIVRFYENRLNTLIAEL